jgi:hypothetical protein
MKRQPRLYSLFEKQADGTWLRISGMSFKLQDARRIFQNALLSGAFGGKIRELGVVDK